MIVNTLIQVFSAVGNGQIIYLLSVFDNIISDISNLNRFENLGYIDSLVKLLNSYVYEANTAKLLGC